MVDIPEQDQVNATIAHNANTTETAQNTETETRDISPNSQDATLGDNKKNDTVNKDIAKLVKREVEEAADVDKNMTVITGMFLLITITETRLVCKYAVIINEQNIFSSV